MKERLQKFMASCGVASRRSSEKLIKAGKVTVNSNIITELGEKVDPNIDIVCVNGEKIKPEMRNIYILLNKPEGYLCTLKDTRDRKTVLDLTSEINERIFPIGRLDYDTSGLIIMTNDGSIYNKVIHPREKINKIYEACIKGTPTKDEMDKFRTGIDIGDYITAQADIKIMSSNNKTSNVKITIHEGKKRQIRRMCKSIGHHVITLRRVAIGNIVLSNLEKGQFRYLTEKEISYIKNL
ncbi:MAG: pseudouridine synthase [Clostridium sp.]|nr:pseudouridine synthase [Clostridium sp.]